MLYAAKCYWPGATRDDLERVAKRAARADLDADGTGVVYLASLLFAADDLVLCLLQGRSRTAVLRASDRLGIPRERLMDPLWIGSARLTTEGNLE
jgi:hypothetical protein